ncbi:MAG TPA: cyclodeaminase/cyclohydrolase family protein [Thermoanaerobaculia bacterium]|jgi:glutamate formiminotransferase/formiminotetrahydrofolate cyclodeaminase
MNRLASLSVEGFAAALASDAPAPGGGSAAAAGGANGAALLAMVVRLTLGKEKYKSAWEDLSPLVDRLDDARAKLVELIDEDTKAFDAVLAARRLPKETDADKAARQKAIDAANVLATAVPMQTAFFAHEALKNAPAILEKGNPNAASDAWAGALAAWAAVFAALANVRINLPGVADPDLLRGFREDADLMEKTAGEALEKTRAIARSRGLAA